MVPSQGTLDATCPNCGSLVWFQAGGVYPLFDTSIPHHEQTPVDLPDEIEVPIDVIELVPESVAQENLIVPLADTLNGLVLAAAHPWDRESIDRIQFLLNRDIQLVYVTTDWIELQLRTHYGSD